MFVENSQLCLEYNSGANTICTAAGFVSTGWHLLGVDYMAGPVKFYSIWDDVSYQEELISLTVAITLNENNYLHLGCTYNGGVVSDPLYGVMHTFWSYEQKGTTYDRDIDDLKADGLVGDGESTPSNFQPNALLTASRVRQASVVWLVILQVLTLLTKWEALQSLSSMTVQNLRKCSYPRTTDGIKIPNGETLTMSGLTIGDE